MSQDWSEGPRQDGNGEGAEKTDLGSAFSLNQSISSLCILYIWLPCKMFEERKRAG